MPHENNKPAKSCFRDATAAHDAETVRLVREWADENRGEFSDAYAEGYGNAANSVWKILNRKPAAKKALSRAGGK